MKLVKLRTNIGIPFRFFPIPKMGNGFVPDQRNQWMIVSEEDKGFNVLNLVMKHEFLLTRDNIRDYREPQTIILRSQVILTEDGGVEFIPFADAPSHELIRLPGGTFEGPLTIGLSPNYHKELELPVTSQEALPSAMKAAEIRNVLETRVHWHSKGLSDSFLRTAVITSSILSPFEDSRYEDRSDETLQKNLADVKKEYLSHDLFEMYETRSHKINVHLLNGGSEYIEDASIQLGIEMCPGLFIANEIPEKPRDRSSYMNVSIPRLTPNGYPTVEETTTGYSVSEEIHNIKHGVPMRAFEEPLRIILTEEAKGHRIRVQCSILGRNLRSPRTEELAIIVV